MSVPLCYVSPRLQHLPGRLQRCDPPTWLAAGNVRYRSGPVSGINWEQGKETTQLQDFALLERQPQNTVALVFQLNTGNLENSRLELVSHFCFSYMANIKSSQKFEHIFSCNFSLSL